MASALGIPSLLPFLKAVCKSKKSWQARHTGIKIVQQIAILMGCAILPHLRNLVEIIEHGMNCSYYDGLSALHSFFATNLKLYRFTKIPTWELPSCIIILSFSKENFS